MLATMIAAHASLELEQPSRSPDLDPERLLRAAEVVADDRADHREYGRDLQRREENGSAFGIRTRRKISISPAAYERISSIDDGRTLVSPRSVFTITGKKHEHRRDRHLRGLLAVRTSCS